MDRLLLRNALVFFAALALASAGGFAAEGPAVDGSSDSDGVGETTRRYQFEVADGGYRLALVEAPIPQVGANDVLVRVHAVSLNRRDWNMLNREVGAAASLAGTIPLSDGAGEVLAIGESVTRFRVGDRVAGIFFEGWIDGPPSEASLETDRGGNAGGMLSELVVTHEDGLVTIPGHLSYEEAATLPCAAVTAWVGLFKRGHLQPGQYVLLEGTGGVSIFGLLFSRAAGAKPIITSSSDDKLEKAGTLGAFATVNYRSNPEWQQEVRELTGGHGVDQVLDVGGRETLNKALDALAYGGHIALIGGLSGYGSDIPTNSLMWINATASGVYVGSREDFEAMNEFVSEHRIRPHIDRVFEFENASEAYDYMGASGFMGKIVIRIPRP
jgi:NADPH:quinone reductase-like Zn-dependent oxidoreductase